MMAGTSDQEKVRAQEEVINRFVVENAVQTMDDILGVRQGVEYFLNEELFAGKFLRDEGEEETKAEVEVDAMGPTTPEGKGGGGVATPDSINKATRGRGLGGGRESGGAAELDYSDEEGGAAEEKDISQLTPLTRKTRSDKGIKRGSNLQTPDRRGMRAEDKPRTRAAAAAEEEDENIKLRLRGADGEY